MKNTFTLKNLLTILCLALILVISPFNAVAVGPDAEDNTTEPQISIAPLNPAFIQYQQTHSDSTVSSNQVFSTVLSVDPLTTSHLLNDPVRPTGLIPSPVDLSHLSPVSMEYSLAGEEVGLMSIDTLGSEIPSRYDLRDAGGVTAVRDQGSAGSCWAHSTLSSLESFLLHNRSQTWDFSENNVKNMLVDSYQDGFDRPSHDDGGFDLFTAAYMARWSGPVIEADDPYNSHSGTSPVDPFIVKHVQNILILPGFNGSDILYKKTITAYGAISVALYYDNDYFDPVNNSFYYSDEVQLANHAVTLVGWDDAYSRYNFTPAAPGDGAFIIKNSWGSRWGENGYFYVSYHDTVMGNNEGISGLNTKPYAGNFIFTAEDVDNYDRIYQYDPLGWTACTGYNNSTAYGANVFTAAHNETLEAVSFYTVDSNSFYNLSIYLDPEDGPLSFSEPVSVKNGSIPFAGYHTIDLDDSITLLTGQNFSVVLNFTTPQYIYPLSIEKNVSEHSSNAYASAGQSYMSSNGINWTDISANGENVCIKAFTREEKEPRAAFVAGKRYVRVDEAVGFHDASLFSPEHWGWDFGDNTTDATQNPVHTYAAPGVYNVSLNASNSYGSDISLRSSLIRVLNPTIIVNSSESADFITISEALLAASSGSTIVVEPGAYTESLSFREENISLVSSTGDPADVSIIPPDLHNDAIVIWADNITVSGISVSGANTGILVAYSNGCNISDCLTYDNHYGIRLYSAEATTISDCTSFNNEYGIWLIDSGDSLIYNNLFNNTNNILVTGGSSNQWNTTMAGASNIINGTHLGGNFWAKPDGTGWSQTQYSVGNGFCQQYEITSNGYNTDHLPLTSNGELNGGNVTEEVLRSDNDRVRVRISSSTEPPANIVAVDSDIRFVGKDAEVKYVFSDRSTPVTDIRFETETTQGHVMASVSLLNELPDDVPEPSSAVTYQLMDIILGDDIFPSSGVSEATIGFAVSKEWITSHNVDKYGIYMQHFSNGVWNRLSTTITDEDETHIYFEAVTTGFSPFMICADVMSLDTEEYGPDSITGNSPEATGNDRDTWDITTDWKGTALKILPGLFLAGILGIICTRNGSSKGKI